MSYIKQFPLKDFKRGGLLLQRGEPIKHLLALRTGFIKVTSITPNGSERLVWIASRYDVAPTEQLFTKNSQARFFYTALTDGTYYEVDKAGFLEYARSNPAIMEEVAYNMSLHYDDFLQRVDAVDNGTVKERLMYTLRYLAKRFSSATYVDLYEYGLRLTHEDVATMIGSTRETTSVMLAELRDKKLINYSRTQFVINVDQMTQALGDE